MAKITRFLPKIFGGSLATSGNLTVIGSEAAGSLAYSRDPAAMQALSQFMLGWKGCVIGNNSPSIQDMQSLFYVLTQMLQYISQQGICEWSADQTYYTGSYCTSAGVTYVSLTDDNLNHAVTNTNNWVPYANTLSSPAFAKAWVRFSGTTGAINAQYNVSSVVRTGPGSYLITFTNPMADAAYGVVGTAGAGNGEPRDRNGNNNAICMDNTSTTTQVSVWCPKPDTNIGEDPDLVAVWVFGN